MRDGDVVCLAGLYGVYEMIWEFIRVEPHWTRRKVILIQFIKKRLYPDHFKKDVIFKGENFQEEWMFWSHYGVKFVVICLFLNL